MLRFVSFSVTAIALSTTALPVVQAQDAEQAPPDPFAADGLSAPAPAPQDGASPAGEDGAPAGQPPAQGAAGVEAQTQAPPPPPGTVVVVQVPAGYQQAAQPTPAAQPSPVVPAQPPAAAPAAPMQMPPPPARHGGVAAEIGGGFLGLGLGTGLTYLLVHDARTLDDVLGGLMAGSIATFWLTDLGIYTFGRITGGQASFGKTLLGVAAGAGVGALLGFGALGRAVDTDAAYWAGLGIMVAGGIAGGVLFFELSDRRRRRDMGYALTPYVAPTRGGGLMGVAARF